MTGRDDLAGEIAERFAYIGANDLVVAEALADFVQAREAAAREQAIQEVLDAIEQSPSLSVRELKGEGPFVAGYLMHRKIQDVIRGLSATPGASGRATAEELRECIVEMTNHMVTRTPDPLDTSDEAREFFRVAAQVAAIMGKGASGGGDDKGQSARNDESAQAATPPPSAPAVGIDTSPKGRLRAEIDVLRAAPAPGDGPGEPACHHQNLSTVCRDCGARLADSYDELPRDYFKDADARVVSKPSAAPEAPREPAPLPMPGGVWTCKIGRGADLPPGADGPMRKAVNEAFERLTGHEAEFTFSGWGGSLTESELAVVEGRAPRGEEAAREAAPADQRAEATRDREDAT